MERVIANLLQLFSQIFLFQSYTIKLAVNISCCPAMAPCCHCHGNHEISSPSPSHLLGWGAWDALGPPPPFSHPSFSFSHPLLFLSQLPRAGSPLAAGGGSCCALCSQGPLPCLLGAIWEQGHRSGLPPTRTSPGKACKDLGDALWTCLCAWLLLIISYWKWTVPKLGNQIVKL